MSLKASGIVCDCCFQGNVARGTFAGTDRLHESLPPRHQSAGGHARESILAVRAQDRGERAGHRQPRRRLRGGNQLHFIHKYIFCIDIFYYCYYNLFILYYYFFIIFCIIIIFK